MSGKRIRVILADDQKLFVDSLGRLIGSRAKDMEVCGIAYDGEQALELVKRLQPDIVLMDIRMPGISGVEATRRIVHEYPSTRVMVLTTFDDDEYIREALGAGAFGYLLKNSSPEEVIASIRAVIHGAVQISSEVARKLVQQMYLSMEASLPSWYYNLSLKEREILVLLSKGFAAKDIAEKVCLAEQTVRNYISGIYKKLGVRTRTEIIRLVLNTRLPG